MFRSTFSADNLTDVMLRVRQTAEDHHVPGCRRLSIMVRELAENVLYHSGKDHGTCTFGMTSPAEFGIEVRDEAKGYTPACWVGIRTLTKLPAC